MNITRTPIRSCSRQTDAAPWYDLDVDQLGKLAVRVANRDGDASPLADTAHDLGKAIGEKSAEVEDARLALAEATMDGELADEAPEIIVVAVTLEDTIEVVPWSQQRREYQAHLGFYNPATDTLELLQFVELHTDEEHAAIDAPDDAEPA